MSAGTRKRLFCSSHLRLLQAGLNRCGLTPFASQCFVFASCNLMECQATGRALAHALSTLGPTKRDSHKYSCLLVQSLRRVVSIVAKSQLNRPHCSVWRRHEYSPLQPLLPLCILL